MNIIKIETKSAYYVSTDEVDVMQDYSKDFVKIGSDWYNRGRDGYLVSIGGNLTRRLEELFQEMHGVMHEQLDLYENDNSGHPDNQRSVPIDTSTGQMWVGAYKDTMRHGVRGGPLRETIR